MVTCKGVYKYVYIILEGVKVVAQPIQFFIAGFETTASAITYTIYELCLNQQLQEKQGKK